MARPRTTVGKLQRDQAKREKAKAKQEDRLARRAERGDGDGDNADPAPDEDQEALLEQFARLHEDLADGRISLDEFESRQDDLRRRLRVD
jgi:transposase